MKDIFEALFRSRPSATGPVEYIVAGLGNPGREYEQTRHNAGFMAVDYMAEQTGAAVKRLRFQSLTGETVLGGKRVLLVKPTTYMNLSGQAVQQALAFYKLPAERLVVISDDVALDVGKIRIRRAGSDGGQKGLKSIIRLTGHDDFPRIRIGVGKKPHPGMELADWVLSRFTKEEQALLAPLWASVLAAAELIVQGDIAEAMNRYN